VLLIAITYNHLPWRSMPQQDPQEDTADDTSQPAAAKPPPPPIPPVKPDAYAESP